MSKIFVLDTNVLLHDPNCIYNFDDNKIVIPICCLEELDKFKSEGSELGVNARSVSRKLSELVCKYGSLIDYVPVGDGFIKIYSRNIDFAFNGLKNSYDNLIIAVAKAIAHEDSYSSVTLVSNDINMRVKAASLGINTSEYKNDFVSDNENVGKIIDISVDVQQMGDLYDDHIASIDATNITFDITPYENMPVIAKSISSGKSSALCFWRNGRLVRFKQRDVISGISTRGAEQAFLMAMLTDPEIDLVVCAGFAGSGKCLGKGTPVLMYDGSIKNVEDVVAGDILMGPDSGPRVVESTTSGVEELFKIKPIKGDPYVVNRSHILSLAMSGKQYEIDDYYGRCIENITIDEYLSKNKSFKKNAKTWRTGVDFKTNNELKIPPYILGVWIGDGDNTHSSEIHNPDIEIIDELKKYAESIGYILNSSDCNGTRCPKHRITSGEKKHSNIFMDMLRHYDLPSNKHIPHEYKTASRTDRLELLAGLMDSDGHLSRGSCYDYVCKEKCLAEDVAFLARSLGFSAYITEKQSKAQNWDYTKTYYRICISGDCCSIPCRVERKKRLTPREQIKDVLVSGITVESIGDGEYYGFSISGKDRLFLLGDFTVTHNTILSIAAGLDAIRTSRKIDRMMFTKSIVPVGNDIGFVPGTKEEKMAEWVKPMYDNMELIMRKTGAKASEYFEKGLVEVDALTYIRGRSLMNRFVIIDECFPYSQRVMTNRGKMQIGAIFCDYVMGHDMPMAKTFNIATGEFEYKKILSAAHNGVRQLVQVKSGNKKIKCTDNHPFLTINGYKAAADLQRGDYLLLNGFSMQNSRWLNDDQLQVAMASYLGDGHIYKISNGAYRIKFIHGAKQEGYLKFKAKMFGREDKIKCIQENGYSKTKAYTTYTLSIGLPFDVKGEDCFQYVVNNLDERGLAIWFMDDGSSDIGGKVARFHTEAFSEAENNILCNMLNTRFGIECSVHRYAKNNEKQYFYISTTVSGFKALCALVEKYIHPELEYKISKNNNEKYVWNCQYADFSVSAVDDVVLTDEFQHVFDIEVEDNHNFIACVGPSSLSNESGFIVHNCQNISASQIRTIVTRIGDSSKLVLLGDLSQIDSPYLNKTNNGLIHALINMHGLPNVGVLRMVKSQRSRLAQQAIDRL